MRPRATWVWWVLAGCAGVSGSGPDTASAPRTGEPQPARGGDAPALAHGCPPHAEYGAPSPAEPRARRIRGGFEFLEGPVWLADRGVLLFSDIHLDAAGAGGPPSTIWRFTPPSHFERFVPEAGSNGLALDPAGNVLACTHDAQTLSRFDPQTGARETLPLTYRGKRFNSPNDLTVRRDGTVYFTDPDWQLGERASETGRTGVYRLPPGGAPELLDGSLRRPNGIALAPDERTLYVGSADPEVLAYPLAEDGSRDGEPRLFATPGASDGLTLDCAGHLYVTAQDGVHAYDPAGRELFVIAVDESPTNVAFGGPERRTLFITARSSLYAIELAVPGYPY